MIKDDSYRIKFEKLQPWMVDIFRAVKKELRNEHLLKTPAFAQKYFPKRGLDKLTNEEFAGAYAQEIAEGNEELGEKVVTRWVMKHAELYHFFATELSKINAKFDEIESLSQETSAFLASASISQFGATATYIFCVMNAVVLTEEAIQKIKEAAMLEKAQAVLPEEKHSFETVDVVHEHYVKEMRKLSEKFEKRIQGIERKYIQDVEGLKKQISQLHKKLGEKMIAVG